jgi:hypothetical protein
MNPYDPYPEPTGSIVFTSLVIAIPFLAVCGVIGLCAGPEARERLRVLFWSFWAALLFVFWYYLKAPIFPLVLGGLALFWQLIRREITAMR